MTSPDRVFDEDEVAAIFERAAADDADPKGGLSRPRGLTLSELRRIGAEAGIPSEAIDRAAASIDVSASTAESRGMRVTRTVDLPGSFTDQDWDRLVFDLHETLQAVGEVRVEGSLRQWQNEHYRVLVEPSDSGHRLRIQTRSEGPGPALFGGLLGGGFLFFAMGALFMMVSAFKGDIPDDLAKTVLLAIFVVVGLLSMGIGAYRLPRWREEQERMLDGVATRAMERVGD